MVAEWGLGRTAGFLAPVVLSKKTIMLKPHFYPPWAAVPERLQDPEFVLRPLRVEDAELDYAAVMESKELLRCWGGGSWPVDDFTVADNVEDLKVHEREHRAVEAYTFTMMNPEENECLGCVYFTPLIELLERGVNLGPNDLAGVDDFETVVRFWVRSSRLDERLDEKLLDRLLSWLREVWAFDKVYFRANDQDKRQIQLLAGARLQPHYVVNLADRAGKYILYAM
jgi:hypothetical protein